VKEVNRLDLDSHADVCIVGKEALIFQDFDHEVNVSGYDQEGEKIALQTMPAVMGYVIPEMGRTVILIVHQSISFPQLEHNLLSIMHMRLHDGVVNETSTFQCLEPTYLSLTISVRCDIVDGVLNIPLDLNSVVSCFPTFKPTQEDFDTCDKHESIYESPAYDLSVKSFI
jgi:hypothetical protein